VRVAAPHAIVRLELDDVAPPLDGRWLADALRDMRMLGLQPTVLAPLAPRVNGQGT
jgi:hypothetical protein